MRVMCGVVVLVAVVVSGCHDFEGTFVGELKEGGALKLEAPPVEVKAVVSPSGEEFKLKTLGCSLDFATTERASELKLKPNQRCESLVFQGYAGAVVFYEGKMSVNRNDQLMSIELRGKPEAGGKRETKLDFNLMRR